MATRTNPRWYTRRVREPGPDIDPSTFQRLEGAEQELGRPLSDDEKRQWLESQPALDPGFVEWHGAPPEEVGNLLPWERVHTADGWWFRSGEGSEAGKYFFKNEAPGAPGGYMRAAENPLSTGRHFQVVYDWAGVAWGQGLSPVALFADANRAAMEIVRSGRSKRAAVLFVPPKESGSTEPARAQELAVYKLGPGGGVESVPLEATENSRRRSR